MKKITVNLIGLLFLGVIGCLVFLFFSIGLQPCSRFDIFQEEGCLYTLKHTSINMVTFSPDGAILATLSFDGTVGLWRASDGKQLQMISPDRYEVESIAFSPDGNTLAMATGPTIEIRQVSGGSLLHTLRGQEGTFTIAFGPNKDILAEGSAGVRLRQVPDGTLLRQFEWDRDSRSSWVDRVAFSPDGTFLAAALPDSTVRVWQVNDGTLLHTLSGHPGFVEDVAFAPDGSTLASGVGVMICVWRMSDGTLLHRLEGHTNSVNSVSYSPDGTILASGGFEGAMKLWRVTDGTLLRTLNLGKWYGNSVKSVAFSPDGKILAVGQRYGPVRVFDVEQILKNSSVE